MAKAKLTKQAVKYIVKLYDSETENYTFLEIKNKVFEKFGIEVSLQAVQQNYHKYMEDITSKKNIKPSVNEVKDIKVSKSEQERVEVRPTPKSSSSNIFNAFSDKKNAVGVAGKQYMDTDELNIDSNEIQNLLKVDE